MRQPHKGARIPQARAAQAKLKHSPGPCANIRSYDRVRPPPPLRAGARRRGSAGARRARAGDRAAGRTPSSAWGRSPARPRRTACAGGWRSARRSRAALSWCSCRRSGGRRGGLGGAAALAGVDRRGGRAGASRPGLLRDRPAALAARRRRCRDRDRAARHRTVGRRRQARCSADGRRSSCAHGGGPTRFCALAAALAVRSRRALVLEGRRGPALAVRASRSSCWAIARRPSSCWSR